MYIAFTVEIDEEENKGLYAFAYPLSEHDNAKAKIDLFPNVKYCNVFQTRKKAREVVAAWNEAYKANGTYAFSKTF